MIFWPGVAVSIGDHGPKRWKVPPPPRQPNDPGVHFSADTQARWVRNGAKREPPEFDTMVKRANARAGIGRQGLCQQGPTGIALHGRHRDGIMRTAARHRSLVIDPCGPGKTRGQADLQTPLEGLRNAYGMMTRRFGLHRTQYFGLAKTRRPASDGGDQAEPARHRKQDHSQPTIIPIIRGNRGNEKGDWGHAAFRSSQIQRGASGLVPPRACQVVDGLIVATQGEAGLLSLGPQVSPFLASGPG
ncbi:MAG: hypothetical protein GDA36_10430 [Rhodobacteraceae bacterium]|nr:hypothetical protein [Paracoccaceae bacterium]